MLRPTAMAIHPERKLPSTSMQTEAGKPYILDEYAARWNSDVIERTYQEFIVMGLECVNVQKHRNIKI